MCGWRLIQVVPALLFAACFLCVPAVGMDLADLQPGITTSDAIEEWLEKATRNAISGSLRIRTFSSNEEGLEELTAWFDESRSLQWARERLTQTLTPRSAALLFDLYGQVTVAQGDSFATPGTEALGSMHHYAADGPADRAGLMQEDVIVSLNRRRVDSAETLRGFLKGRKPGASVRLGVLRDGATETVEVTLAAPRSLPVSGWGGQWPKPTAAGSVRLNVVDAEPASSAHPLHREGVLSSLHAAVR